MTWHTFWELVFFSAISKLCSLAFIFVWIVGIWFSPFLSVIISLSIFMFLSIFLSGLLFYERFYFIASISVLVFLCVLSCIVSQRKHFSNTCELYSIIVSICNTISPSVWIFILFLFSCIYTSWFVLFYYFQHKHLNLYSLFY